MARVTHVKKAQQRFETRPVLDEHGTPKRTPVMRRDGTQKTTKRGALVFMNVTEADRTQPLPLLECGYCHKPIEVGTPYKHISPKSGPYGGRQLNRHETCPSWHVWEYSNSLSARAAQIEHEALSGLPNVESTDDVQSILDEAAEAIRSLGQEKFEAAENMEEGFGHETSQSAELHDQAEQLEAWADEVESANIPDYPEPEEDSEDCVVCDGTGHTEDGEEYECTDCTGTGMVTPDEPTEDQIEEWRTEVEDALSILGECPV